MSTSLRVKLLTEHAKLPQRGSLAAAGYDLCSAYAGVVPARGKALLKTDIAIAVPPGTYGRVGASRRAAIAAAARGSPRRLRARTRTGLRRTFAHTFPPHLSLAAPRAPLARAAPRSGLALKNGIDVGAGVIGASPLHFPTAQLPRLTFIVFSTKKMTSPSPQTLLARARARRRGLPRQRGRDPLQPL